MHICSLINGYGLCDFAVDVVVQGVNLDGDCRDDVTHSVKHTNGDRDIES